MYLEIIVYKDVSIFVKKQRINYDGVGCYLIIKPMVIFNINSNKDYLYWNFFVCSINNYNKTYQ